VEEFAQSLYPNEREKGGLKVGFGNAEAGGRMKAFIDRFLGKSKTRARGDMLLDRVIVVSGVRIAQTGGFCLLIVGSRMMV
jgi:hypothetical protein